MSNHHVSLLSLSSTRKPSGSCCYSNLYSTKYPSFFCNVVCSLSHVLFVGILPGAASGRMLISLNITCELSPLQGGTSHKGGKHQWKADACGIDPLHFLPLVTGCTAEGSQLHRIDPGPYRVHQFTHETSAQLLQVHASCFFQHEENMLHNSLMTSAHTLYSHHLYHPTSHEPRIKEAPQYCFSQQNPHYHSGPAKR